MKVRDKSGIVFEVVDEGRDYYTGRIIGQCTVWAFLKADCTPYPDERWEDVTADFEVRVNKRVLSFCTQAVNWLSGEVVPEGYRLVKRTYNFEPGRVFQVPFTYFTVEKRIQ